jgi:hypothetical protein
MSETFKEPTPVQHYKNYRAIMDETSIHEELLKINNIHSSLDATSIMTYIILRETHKHKFNDAQLEWIQQRIDSLHEKQRLATEDSLSNVDLELCRMPLSSKTSDVVEVKQVL